jgi:hypothetical protein
MSTLAADHSDVTVANLPRLLDILRATRDRCGQISAAVNEKCPASGVEKLVCKSSSCGCGEMQKERKTAIADLDVITSFVNTARLLRGDITFDSRGIGNDWRECFVCGKNKDRDKLMNNIAAYVQSKNDGDTIVSWFGGIGAWNDFRVREPHYIQVKIYACNKHLHLLKDLDATTRDGGAISKADVEAIIERGKREMLGSIPLPTLRRPAGVAAWPKCYGNYDKLGKCPASNCPQDIASQCKEETRKFDDERAERSRGIMAHAEE